jgi:hypothetical protein
VISDTHQCASNTNFKLKTGDLMKPHFQRKKDDQGHYIEGGKN